MTALNSDVSADSDPDWVRWVQSVLRVGGFLTTLSGRRHVVYATQDSPISYEQMLALDENNPRRGVMKMVMDQLPTVRPLQLDIHPCLLLDLKPLSLMKQAPERRLPEMQTVYIALVSAKGLIKLGNACFA